MSGKSTTAGSRSPRSRRRVASWVVGLLSLCGCGGPWGPFPGGRLSGDERPYPSAGFDAFAELETIAVEVGGEEPRSVQTWAVVLDSQLFVPADFINPGKRWPHQAMADPRARVRLGRDVFAGRLTRIEDSTTIDTLRRATSLKYGIEPDSWAARVEVWWFRFAPP